MAQNNPLPSDTRNKLHDGGTSKVPPNPPEPQEARGGVALKLSHEDAERYASQIRPSWDFVDEDVAANVAADLGLPIEVKPAAENKPAEAKADAKPSATKPPSDEAKVPAPNEAGATKTSDTIIEGVPTLAIGGDPEPVPAAAVSGEIPVDVDEPPIAASPVVAVGGAVNVEAAAIAAETKAEPAPQEPPRKPQVRSKTRIGLGEGEDQPEKPSTKSAPASAPAAPATPVASSRRAVNVAPAAAGTSKPPFESPAPARANSPTPAPAGDEDIEIPGVSRSSNNTMMIVAALVAVLGLSFGAWALLRGGDKKAETPDPKPAVTAPPAMTATTPPPPAETAKATPPPADTPAVTTPPAATTPPPPVTAEPKATAKPADKPVDKPAPKPVAEKPAPAPSPKPEVKKPSGGKPTGGIIRETPF